MVTSAPSFITSDGQFIWREQNGRRQTPRHPGPDQGEATRPIQSRDDHAEGRGSIENEGIACKVETGRALAVAGLHPATGGSGLELCSGDMLLEALVACAGVTLKSVATAIEVPLKTGIVTAEGDLDFRGTLGVDKEAPVGFAEIRLRFDVDTSRRRRSSICLLKLTERYCVVYQTIKNGPKVSVTMQKDVSIQFIVVPAKRRPGPIRRIPSLQAPLFDSFCAQTSGCGLRVPAFAGTTSVNVPRPRFHPDARAAHGDHGRVRGVGLHHHRALGPGDRRVGRDAADFGRTLLCRFSRSITMRPSSPRARWRACRSMPRPSCSA